MSFICPLGLSHSFTGVSIARGSPVLDESLFDCSGLYCCCFWLFVCFLLSVFIHYIYISVSVNVCGFVHLWFSLCKCYCLCFWFSSCVWTCYDQCSWQDMIILLTVFFFSSVLFSVFVSMKLWLGGKKYKLRNIPELRFQFPKQCFFLESIIILMKNWRMTKPTKIGQTQCLIWQTSVWPWMNEWMNECL